MRSPDLSVDNKSERPSRATSMVSVTQTLTEPEQAANGASTPKDKESAPLESYSEKKVITPEVSGDQTPVQSGSDAEDTTKYPTGLALGLIVLALCLAVFLVALDQTIIATAIPKITGKQLFINSEVSLANLRCFR